MFFPFNDKTCIDDEQNQTGGIVHLRERSNIKKTIMCLKKSIYIKFVTQIKFKRYPPINTFPIAIGSVQLVLLAIIDSILN